MKLSLNDLNTEFELFIQQKELFGFGTIKNGLIDIVQTINEPEKCLLFYSSEQSFAEIEEVAEKLKDELKIADGISLIHDLDILTKNEYLFFLR